MSIPAGDPKRTLTLSNSDSPDQPHIGLVGDTYTVLLSGKDTAGRYCLIDMHIPPGGGPPPHRHDFEESFTVLEGEIEVAFRDQGLTVRAGECDQHSRECSAPVSEQVEAAGPALVLVLTGRTGRVFP